jgi:hypothetical protein
MTKYHLLNFDLGPKIPFNNFSVGPYKIKLSDKYSNLRQEVLKGKNVITATATCMGKEGNSLLTYNDNEKGFWDLCFILSFLTGNRFAKPGHERHFTYAHQCEIVVGIKDFLKAANIMWGNRNEIKSEKLPFWYYLDIIDTPIWQYKGLYGCISLEIIQNNEVKQSHFKNFICGYKNMSYFDKLKQLFIKYDVLTENMKKESIDRISLIVEIRNFLAHGREKIRTPKSISVNKEIDQLNIFFICSVFIPTVIQVYISNKFGLQNFYKVILNKGYLQEYILRGTWENREIDDIIQQSQLLS